jgi:hypothetical protein
MINADLGRRRTAAYAMGKIIIFSEKEKCRKGL